MRVFFRVLLIILSVISYMAIGTREMAQWLRAHTVLVEDQSLVLEIKSGGSQLPIILAPGDLTSSSGFQGHLHPCV